MNSEIRQRLSKSVDLSKNKVEQLIRSHLDNNFKDEWVTLSEIYNEYLALSFDESVEAMYKLFQQNYERFWISEKYNADLSAHFNLIVLEHPSIYTGYQADAFAAVFDFDDSSYPDFGDLDENIEYTGHFECLPSFNLIPSSILYKSLAHQEPFWSSNPEAIDFMNDLCTSTSYLMAHEVLKRHHQSYGFDALNLDKPFCFAIQEHDSGLGREILYIIN